MKISKEIQKLIIVTIIITVVGSFYWYEYRPTQIRKKCSPALYKTEQINDGSIFGARELTDKYYKACLSANGLKD